MPIQLPSISRGKRAVISGRTGSGKTTLAVWLLNRSRQHWVILNPKWTGAYKMLPEVNILKGYDAKKVDKSIEKNQYTVINFNGKEANPKFMDAVVDDLHGSYENIGLCADELYTLHEQGKAGDGLTGWLTRGRELKQSFIGLTQRPCWISRFLYSEADYICGMDLALADDRKRLLECTGQEYFINRLTPRRWLWYEVDKDHIVKYGPVPIGNLQENVTTK